MLVELAPSPTTVFRAQRGSSQPMALQPSLVKGGCPCPLGPAVPAGRVVPCPNAPFYGQAEITIVAGYGSTKDVSVYSSLGLAPAHIYIVGRAVKKFHNQCQVRWWGWGHIGAAGDNC